MVLTLYSPTPRVTKFSDQATSVYPGHASMGYKLNYSVGIPKSVFEIYPCCLLPTHAMSKWYPVRPLTKGVGVGCGAGDLPG